MAQYKVVTLNFAEPDSIKSGSSIVEEKKLKNRGKPKSVSVFFTNATFTLVEIETRRRDESIS